MYASVASQKSSSPSPRLSSPHSALASALTDVLVSRLKPEIVIIRRVTFIAHLLMTRSSGRSEESCALYCPSRAVCSNCTACQLRRHGGSTRFMNGSGASSRSPTGGGMCNRSCLAGDGNYDRFGSRCFHTTKVRFGHSAMSAPCPVYPRADMAGPFMSDTPEAPLLNHLFV